MTDIDQETLDVLAATTDRLCEQYAYRPAAQLRREAGSWLRYISGLLDRRIGLREHRELLVTAGWLALLVGCIEYDSGLSVAAEATRVSASQLGTEARRWTTGRRPVSRDGPTLGTPGAGTGSDG